MFQYQRNIHVYETDLMGIVHHSNYLRFCEEARVAWANSRNLLGESEKSVFDLAVYETRVMHRSPARYRDLIKIDVQASAQKAKLVMQYRLAVGDRIVALAQTVHCRIDENFKVQRLSQKLLETVEKEKWTETWL